MKIEPQESNMLLNEQHIAAVKYFFKNNPDITKLSRRQPIVLADGSEIQLPYSVLKGEETNGETKFYALFRAYRKNDGNPITATLNDDPKQLFGQKKEVYGKGTYGFAKGGQNIETGEKVVVKRYFPDHSTDFKKLLKDVKYEEQGLQKTGKYKDSVIRSADTDLQNTDAAYTVMEIVPGKSLLKFFSDGDIKTYDDETKLKIMLNILEATKYMHSTGIVAHNDLGKQNIMIDEDLRVAIIDFGLSVYSEFPYRLPYTLTQEEIHYCAPESRIGAIEAKITTGQRDLSGKMLNYINSAADIYSLGFQFSNYWSIFLSDQNKDLLRRLASNMMETSPKDRPSIDECIQTLQSILILNYLQKNKVEEARLLLNSYPMAVYYNISLFEICLEQKLVDLKDYQLSKVLQEFFRQGTSPDQIFNFIKNHQPEFPISKVLQEFFRQEISIDQIFNFIKNHQSELPNTLHMDSNVDLYDILVREIRNDNMDKAKEIALQLYAYNDILKIQQLLSSEKIFITFDSSNPNNLQILDLCRNIADGISKIDDFNKMILILEEISKINNNFKKIILMNMSLSDQNDNLKKIRSGDVVFFSKLIQDLNTEDDRLKFLIKNIEFIKFCIKTRPTFFYRDLAKKILSDENWQIFLSNFSAQELRSYVRNFMTFQNINSALKQDSQLQKQFFDTCAESWHSLILCSSDFLEAISFFSEQQKSIIINDIDFAKIFTQPQDLLYVMNSLSKEEFIEILQNKKFLASITPMIPNLFYCCDLPYYHENNEKLLFQYVDILRSIQDFDIKKLIDHISMLPLEERYNFFSQSNLQDFFKNSLKNIDDVIIILKLLPIEQRHDFIIKSNMINVIKKLFRESNDKQNFISLIGANVLPEHRKLLEELFRSIHHLSRPRIPTINNPQEAANLLKSQYPSQQLLSRRDREIKVRRNKI